MRRSCVFNARQRVFSHGDAAKTCGQLQRLVAVAHPHLDGRRQSGKERRSGIFNGHLGLAILALGRRTDFAAQMVHDEMESIADAKDRNAQRQHARIRFGRIGIVNRRRTAGKNHADGLVGLNVSQRRRTGQHHGKDILFADAPRDELRILRPEIEDDNCLGVHAPSVAGGLVRCKDSLCSLCRSLVQAAIVFQCFFPAETLTAATEGLNVPCAEAARARAEEYALPAMRDVDVSYQTASKCEPLFGKLKDKAGKAGKRPCVKRHNSRKFPVLPGPWRKLGTTGPRLLQFSRDSIPTQHCSGTIKLGGTRLTRMKE